MTNEKAVAEKLLQAGAVQLRPQEPFTWASGWKSPIYCDNRRVLSFPYIRDFIKSELCNVIFEKFPEADALAGVATAGIAWGAMAADQLKLPFLYVRPKPKEHGMGNQIEGAVLSGQKVIVVEDLISTGKSSLQVVDVLRQAGVEVVGMAAKSANASTGTRTRSRKPPQINAGAAPKKGRRMSKSVSSNASKKRKRQLQHCACVT